MFNVVSKISMSHPIVFSKLTMLFMFMTYNALVKQQDQLNYIHKSIKESCQNY